MVYRLLYVGTVLDPKFQRVGGEPTVARDLIDYLQASFEVHTLFDNFLARNFTPIKRLTSGFRTFGFKVDVNRRVYNYYIKVINRINPDIILSQYDYDTTIIEAANTLNKKIIVYTHIYWPICPKLTLLNQKGVCNGFLGNNCYSCTLRDYTGLNKLAIKLLSNKNSLNVKMNNRVSHLNYPNVTIIALNKRMMNLFVNNGIDENSIKVIENGIDLTLFNHSNVKKEQAICYLGGLNNLKGYRTFLEIAEYLHARYESVRIYATGEYNNRIKRKYQYITFTGLLNKGDLVKLLQKCKVLVFPSIWMEPSSAVPIEAAAVGTVTVGSQLSNLEAIIEHGVTGYIIDGSDSISSYFRYIEQLLFDEHLFNEFSTKLIARTRKFANRNVTYENITNLIGTIINKDSKSSNQCI